MTESAAIRPRNPWLALLLSLIMAGLGHVYCGRIAKGVMIILISALSGQGALLLLTLGHPHWSYPVSITMWAISGAVWLYAIVDSVRTARRSAPDYQLKDYNRWYVYLALILLTVPMSLSRSLVVREASVEAFYIPANSMYPTVHSGDRILADKRILQFEPLQRGDLIVFINPNDRRQRWVKRVVGLPGDRVEMRSDRVLLNGEELLQRESDASHADDEDGMPNGDIVWEQNGAAEYRIFLTGERITGDPAIQNFDELTVPPGHCFVLGDNRHNSKDSRFVGSIPMHDIVGRVDYRYFPTISRLR